MFILSGWHPAAQVGNDVAVLNLSKTFLKGVSGVIRSRPG
jgi:hypothetical protein